MSCSSFICACETQGISFPFSLPASPTQLQVRILKPIYSGFVESSNFSTPKMSFCFKRGLQRRMIWSIFSSSAGLKFYDLWYCLGPLLLLKTRCLSCSLTASEIVSYEELVTFLKSLAEAYKDTGVVPACYVLSRANTCQVSYPIISASHHSFKDNNNVNREVKATEF